MSRRADTVPCTFCGEDTEMVGTRLCDPCWDVRAAVMRKPEVALKIVRDLGFDPLHTAALEFGTGREKIVLAKLSREELEGQFRRILFVLDRRVK